MVRQDNLGRPAEAKQVANQKRLAFGTPGENQSIDRGQFRVGGTARILIDGSGGIIVHGTFNGDGTITWTGVSNLNGTVNLNGPVNITGTQTVTGILNVNGPWNLAGTGGITGNVSSTGNWTQSGNYTLTGSGRITLASGVFLGPTSRGPGLQFDDGSTFSKQTYGLAMNATDTSYVAASALGTLMKFGSFSIGVNALGSGVTGNLAVSGSFTAASKSFKIPHPVKPDTWLLHGVTESNEHGVEYRGDAVIGQDGSTAIDLPDYFEALTEPGSTVYVTGRGFCPDWSDVVGNGFTVTGEPGKRFSWLVKAARSDVTLVTEEPMETTGP